MRQVKTIMFKRGNVRHLALKVDSPIRFYNHDRTLCGIDTFKRQVVIVDGDRTAFGYDLCKTCARARRNRDLDIVLPERDGAATRRAEAMGVSAHVRQIDASVFRVQGSTDTYTVTVPTDGNLATLCNCMAGKVHPEKECKHQASVRMMSGGERLEVAG